jgi:3-oxoacyl-[acyl-carrier-protein] synthase II
MVLSSSPSGGYARVLGGAMTQDAHHVISIEPNHTQLRRCWTTGLANAGVHPLDVAYLNAHGPGTRQCDTAEAMLLDEMLPAAAGVYSFKPLTGHCQGAAAAVEVARRAWPTTAGSRPCPRWPRPSPPAPGPGAAGAVRCQSPIGMGGNNLSSS